MHGREVASCYYISPVCAVTCEQVSGVVEYFSFSHIEELCLISKGF